MHHCLEKPRLSWRQYWLEVHQPTAKYTSWQVHDHLEKPAHVKRWDWPSTPPKEISSPVAEAPSARASKTAPWCWYSPSRESPSNLEEALKSNTSVWDPVVPEQDTGALRRWYPGSSPVWQAHPLHWPAIWIYVMSVSIPGHWLSVHANQWPAEQEWWTPMLLVIQEDNFGAAQSL